MINITVGSRENFPNPNPGIEKNQEKFYNKTSFMELSKAYEPKNVEGKIYAFWEKSGFFNPDNLPKKTHSKKPYAMVMAPPNITGSLHMGHALESTLSDILIRKKRMEGHQTLWLPGTDHAGIATQNIVEKELKKEGLTRFDLGREKFIEKVWRWKEKYGNAIVEQLKALGVSADWSRTRFTMDAPYQKAVEKAFSHYYKKGWIYRGERCVNWCPRCRTSLSDLEIEYREEKGNFYYIKYGQLTLGTTRPETKLGDTALAAHPSDKRYKDYVGKEITIKSVDPTTPKDKEPKLKEIRIKVIADKAVDPKFGTGIVKVTPAHDAADFEIHRRHPEIPIVQVIGPDGRMTEGAGIRYAGMKTAEARKQIIEDLEKLGLIEKTEDYAHNISLCYRCGSMIEPILSKQWFLKMDQLAKAAMKAVKTGKVKFTPKRWEKIYLDWLRPSEAYGEGGLRSIRDWCISRQIWWGHKIPLEGVDDVLDTWFSSALWPFAALGWPEKTNDLAKFYPTDFLTNDRGIINLWDARMIFSGLEFMKKEPFPKLYIHGTILTKEGKRMSKSLGTGIDPLLLIEKYGADATRWGLAWQTGDLQDIRFGEDNIVMGEKFCNKIWNASRFVLGQIGESSAALPRRQAGLAKEGGPNPKTAADKKILKALDGAAKETADNIEKLQFGKAAQKLYDFFWHDFCDVYIETAKTQIKNQSAQRIEGSGAQTKTILLHVLLNSLKLLHPFVPFVTETIYQQLPLSRKEKCLMIESWPRL